MVHPNHLTYVDLQSDCKHVCVLCRFEWKLMEVITFIFSVNAKLSIIVLVPSNWKDMHSHHFTFWLQKKLCQILIVT